MAYEGLFSKPNPDIDRTPTESGLAKGGYVGSDQPEIFAYNSQVVPTSVGDSNVLSNFINADREALPAPVIATQVASSAEIAAGGPKLTRKPRTPLDQRPQPKVVKKDILELLAGLKPAPAEQESPQEIERKERAGRFEAHVAMVGDLLATSLGGIDSADLPALERALKALATVSQSGVKAISAIPDAKVEINTAAPEPLPGQTVFGTVVDTFNRISNLQVERDVVDVAVPAEETADEPVKKTRKPRAPKAPLVDAGPPVTEEEAADLNELVAAVDPDLKFEAAAPAAADSLVVSADEPSAEQRAAAESALQVTLPVPAEEAHEETPQEMDERIRRQRREREERIAAMESETGDGF